MALRTKAPLPLPPEQLKAVQERLLHDYDSVLWEGDGRAILVASVPRDAPDLVNDLEHVVEHAAPSDVEAAQSCLLLGKRQIHAVPVAPLKSLMADRVAFDHGQCESLRAQLPATLGHTLYRAPDDPRRMVRLAVRVPGDHVDSVREEDLEGLVDRLGPLAEKGRLDELHCVYVVASKDHVRIEPEPFVADILERWQDPERQARIDEEARRAEEEARLEKERARRQRFEEAQQAHREAPAPSKRPAAEAESTLHADMASVGSGPLQRPHGQAASGERAGPEGRGGDGPGTRPETSSAAPEAAPSGRTAGRGEGFLDSPRQIDAIRFNIDTMAAPGWETPQRHVDRTPGSPALDRLRSQLHRAGFEVMSAPDVPGHRVDLAAERAAGDPQRVIATEFRHLAEGEAEAFLRAARDLDVDLALAVSDNVAPEARKRLVATKVRVVATTELAHLQL